LGTPELCCHIRAIHPQLAHRPITEHTAGFDGRGMFSGGQYLVSVNAKYSSNALNDFLKINSFGYQLIFALQLLLGNL
jgi:hypothetical protein